MFLPVCAPKQEENTPRGNDDYVSSLVVVRVICLCLCRLLRLSHSDKKGENVSSRKRA